MQAIFGQLTKLKTDDINKYVFELFSEISAALGVSSRACEEEHDGIVVTIEMHIRDLIIRGRY